MGITIILILFLAVISSVVFFAKPKEIPYQVVFNKPKVNINFSILDSVRFNELEPFTEMEIQFSYSALAEAGKVVTGLISAPSMDDAREILKSLDLTVISIEEVQTGRENPFTPYFQIIGPDQE